ncbi:MAG TPA: tRNA 2-selenouridine(34) synthase MnmH [Parvularcula sp.]|nr:tRNA 2-selenouridine(34) synthase MnmH [Parvularcula sp.]HBS31374.1 tRNA 2-selenouridine(34) synthase MnmH [Parvularcula sp.]
MIEPVADLSPETLSRYDCVIDVRSPAEFAEDHLPDAINMPVLSNEERAEVGTIYVRDSRFRARRLGAALIARNVARHLENALSEKPAKFRPLLYCWRGGMRSHAMATILSAIGWRTGVVEGGYKSWRRMVVDALFTSVDAISFLRLDGATGSGKTAVLRAAMRAGAQAIDLEALAHHKGSVFGAAPGSAQPPQKLFESRLFNALRHMDGARPILVEAESAHIGRITLPRRVWKAMAASPCVVLAAPQAARADQIVHAYRDFIAAPGAVATAIDRLRPFHPKERIAEWQALAAAEDWRALAAALMALHYDPLYARARRRGPAPVATVKIDRLDSDEIERAAALIVDLTRVVGVPLL